MAETRDMKPWQLTTRTTLALLESAWGATGDPRFWNLREMISLLLSGEVDRAIWYVHEIHKDNQRLGP